ncbi:hypothetical protein B296_00013005 [Ensete ventricosum]|uniref:Uncharacterized protein n=1 Tax=Ensete ventricosum TaxID=4639 RepID=A0A426Z532_ENSVE|nr:hypothetical protein B296_00013005 [Ensete ventricosum]
MDLNALRRKPRMPSVKNTMAAGTKSSPLDVEEICVEATTKRSVESSAPDRAVTSRPGKWVKIAVRKHKSRHGEGSSRRAAWEKELAAQAGRVCPHGPFGYGPRRRAIGDPHGEPAIHLEAEVVKLKSEGDPEQLAADDELLRLMRENKTLKIELPSKSVADYKQPVGFGWGLQRMGQVSYEFGYRVALARFQARYPNLEMDSDPFTEKLEDSSVPIETRQEFDDFIPLEE